MNILLKPLLLALSLLFAGLTSTWVQAENRQLAYLLSDQRIPFWDIMRRGVASQAAQKGYALKVLSANNDRRTELENMATAIRAKVDGIILSPTNSAAAATLLKLAERARIPVVIADIGSDGGQFVSYISSNNLEGAYQIGRILAHALRGKHWEAGSVGIIAIPQKRANGQARTSGFSKAMQEAGIRLGGMRQQSSFSYQETYDFTRELLSTNPDMRALWLQGSDRYQAALDGIAAENRAGQVLLICFDAEPEFLQLIPKGTLVGAGMQQPFLMGEEAVTSLDLHLHGEKVLALRELPVLPVSRDNIQALLPTIRRNVLGLTPR